MKNDSYIGRTVNYTGDVSNAPRTGFIASVVNDRWGNHAVIVWDDIESFGWDEFGDVAPVKNATTLIGLHQIVEANEARLGSDKFIFA